MSVFSRYVTLQELIERKWNDFNLSHDDIPCSDVYGDKFRKRSIELEKIDDDIGKDAFRALADILNLHLEPSDKVLPFRPMVIMQDKRSLALEDFDEKDVDILENIASESDIPIARARLCDVTWVTGNAFGRKNWKYGALAAKSYLEAIRHSFAVKKELYLFSELQRGLYLAWKFRNHDEQCLDDYWLFMEEVYRYAVDEQKTGLACRVLRVFAEKRHSKSGELAETAEQLAHDISKQGPNPDISDLWNVISILWRNSGEQEKSRKALIECGENYIVLGNIASSSALGSVHWYEDGLECLRRGKADPDRIQAIHKKLLELGEGTLSEMAQISTEFDASEVIQAARKHVANLPFKEALINFTYGYELINPQKIRETIEECMKNTPMQYIFEAKYMSSDGKTVGIRPSLMASGEEYEKAMAAHMVDHANRFDLSMRVRLYISPAHQQIWNEHHPTYADLYFFMRNNPFIPPGHEEAYLRGILAGFIGDWVVAAYLLVPQIEASIRYVLQQSGVITSTVLTNGLQEERSLNQLLTMPDTEKIFGDRIVFELKALLIEDLGGNLRNNLAHGMLTDNECYAEHMVNLWWLILRLSLMPLLKKQIKNNEINE